MHREKEAFRQCLSCLWESYRHSPAIPSFSPFAEANPEHTLQVKIECYYRKNQYFTMPFKIRTVWVDGHCCCRYEKNNSSKLSCCLTLLTHSLTKRFISGAKLRPNIWRFLILVCRMQEAVAQTMHEVPPGKQKNEIRNCSCPPEGQGRAGLCPSSGPAKGTAEPPAEVNTQLHQGIENPDSQWFPGSAHSFTASSL